MSFVDFGDETAGDAFSTAGGGGSGLFGGVTPAGAISGAGGIIGALGDFAEGSAYGKAAQYADINAGIAAEQGRIKEAQTQRQIFQVEGQQTAGYAGAGLAQTGTALDVMRNTVQQGALQKAIVAEQTNINVTGYEQQAAQFKGLQSASNAAGVGGLIGGIASIFGL